MSYAQRHDLKPGDELISPIFLTGLTKHHAVYLGTGEYGVEWISENDAEKGVRLVTAQDYFSRIRSFRINAFKGTEQQRDAAVLRAYGELGKPYDLVRHNCEHYASFVQTGIATSKQLALVVFGLTTLLIIWLLGAGTNKKY